MFWISTNVYFTVGSGTHDAIFNRISETGISVICATLDCCNKDVEELESSITSKIEYPIFPKITAVCILVVATANVCVGLLLIRDSSLLLSRLQYWE